MYVCIYTPRYTYIHIYIYTYIHTHVFMYSKVEFLLNQKENRGSNVQIL